MAKLRMKGSSLNNHLYKLNITDSCACRCGFVNEDEFHFFFICPFYHIQRVNLLSSLGHFILDVRILLYGSPNLDLAENKLIILETLKFINDTKRFE